MEWSVVPTSGTNGKVLVDRFGRVIDYLRISVTDRCNLRCQYCLPEGFNCFEPREELLSFEEIVQVVQVANQMGIDKVRITGGEPLLRKGLPRLVRMLRSETRLSSLSLTTNGLLLPELAEELAQAGLDWVNVSLDSLDPVRYRMITRYGELERVWEGIRRASEAGLSPVKVNVLVLRGINDDEIEDWIRLTEDHQVTVRFLELMPIGEGARLFGLAAFVDLTEVRKEMVRRFGMVPARPERGNGPARYWKIPGARGMVGFITPISEPYCDQCNRLRLTATAKLRPCLAYDRQIDLKQALRRGDRQAVREAFLRAAGIKPWGHAWQQGATTEVLMSRIGG